MKCPKCGTELEENTMFCFLCGEKTEKLRKNNENLLFDENKKPAPTKSAAFSVIGFIFALLSWIPYIYFFTFIPGLIFSIQGLKSRKNGLARAGVIIYIVYGVQLFLGFSILLVLMIAERYGVS